MTGGKTGKEAPVDSMDELFSEHDKFYELKKDPLGDIRLLRGLEGLPQNPKNWTVPPTNMQKAIEYRQKATGYFRLKLLVQTGEIY